ncbi:hypothetical protein V6N13_038351 [Hibiscus sabdariffa]
MSFVFQGTRSDIESGFPVIIPERRTVTSIARIGDETQLFKLVSLFGFERVHAGRPVNSNSLLFLVTVLLLFMILNSRQMSPNVLLWLVLGVFFMATSLRMYAACQQLQAQAQAHAVVASALSGHTELQLHVPPLVALATRGHLQGLRLQLALIDQELDDLDYETLRALDSDNVPSAASMSEEEINALPVHKYNPSAPQSSAYSNASPMQQASSSNSRQLWLVLGVFFMATSLRMYAACQQLQAQAQAHAVVASALSGHTELQLHVPPLVALATRGHLQGLRLQLALIDQELDDLDYETLRALDSDNVPSAASMSEEEINALPVHKYNPSAPQSNASPMQQASSSNSRQKRQDSTNPISIKKGSENELTCSVCLEQVSVGDLIRSLPCLHQFHANCIDPWLQQQVVQ